MRPRVIASLILASLALLGAGAWLWTPDRSRADLELKYLKSKSDLRDIGGAILHVRDSGDASSPALIMLHGFGSSLQTWDAFAERVSANYRVVRFDLPGSGLSAPDARGDYTDARTLEILALLMASLKIDKASFIGNSLGGRVAWKFAAQHPERVEKLILIAPDGFESPGFKYGEAPHVPAVFKLMRYVLPRAMLRQNLTPSYSDPTRLSEVTVDRYYDLLLAPGARDAMIARMEQTVLSPPEPLLKKIEAPTLLLWGAKDAMIPIANADDYKRSIKNATVIRLDDLGHVPHEEAPDTAFQPIEAFLKQ